MLGEIETPSNPVSAEDIVGIPKDNDNLDSKGQSKSPDLKIPKDVQADFYEFVEDKYKFYAAPDQKVKELKKYPNELFVNAQVVDSYDKQTTSRINYRYQESRNINGVEYPAGFSRQNELMFHENGFWMISRYDVSPYINRGGDSPVAVNKAAYLDKGYGGRLDFSQVLDDQALDVTYSTAGSLWILHFDPIEGDKSLIEGVTGDTDGGIDSYERAHGLLYLTLKDDGRLHYIMRDVGPPGEFIDLTAELIVDGRKVEIANTVDNVKFVFFQKDEPEKVAYEISVPKHQNVVSFDTGGKIEKRFEWEQDLIPEPLRRNPMMPPGELDDDWKRVDLASTIGIKIEKGLSS